MTDSQSPEITEVSHPPAVVTTLVTPIEQKTEQNTEQQTEQPPVVTTPVAVAEMVPSTSAGSISATNVHLPPVTESETQPQAEAEAETETETEVGTGAGAEAGVEADPGPPMNEVTADKVSLTMLLVSGKRKMFKFDSKDTIAKVKERVFEDWPKEWADEAPSSTASLKIVYYGKFLENETTLESNKILPGQETIVHLTIKNLQGNELNNSKGKDTAPKCKICIIL